MQELYKEDVAHTQHNKRYSLAEELPNFLQQPLRPATQDATAEQAT